MGWDETGINCYVMGQKNMSHGQACKFIVASGQSFGIYCLTLLDYLRSEAVAIIFRLYNRRKWSFLLYIKSAKFENHKNWPSLRSKIY